MWSYRLNQALELRSLVCYQLSKERYMPMSRGFGNVFLDKLNHERVGRSFDKDMENILIAFFDYWLVFNQINMLY